MKTLYEKAVNLSKYVLDIMYMMQYHNDIYTSIHFIRTTDGMVVNPRVVGEKVRSYMISTNRPDPDYRFSYITQYRDKDYCNFDYIITLTTSHVHIKNKMNSNKKYCFCMFSNHNEPELIQMLNLKESGLGDLLHMSRNAIENNTIVETEFQSKLLHCDSHITNMYLYLLLEKDLKSISTNKELIIGLGSTDILRFVPARKAYIEFLDKEAPNGWRETIQNSYGHTIG